jgi:hypothetical protein
MNLQDVAKKIQYIVIDSKYITQGSPNNFTVNFTNQSNVYIQELRDVIGIRMVDFFVTQVGTSDDGTSNVAKYIDILCPTVPTPGQMLSEQRGQIFNRVALERNFSGAQNLIVHDSRWTKFDRHVNYFNPISLNQLQFQLYEGRGDGDYALLKPDVAFYMIIEITTVDHKEPPRDPYVRMEQSVDKLCRLLEQQQLQQQMKEADTKKEPKKIPFYYLVILLALTGGGLFYFLKPRPPPPLLG